MELNLFTFELYRRLAKLQGLVPLLFRTGNRQSKERNIVRVVLVAFERTPQFHQGLFGVFVLEQLDAFLEISHTIGLCGLVHLRHKSEAHGGSFSDVNSSHTKVAAGAVRSLLT